MGSGNLAVTNALRDAGARFYAARHEGGAICMADGYGRVSGRLAACSVHQGPGLTNTVTGLTEAAKSRTPLIVLAAEMPAAALRSNFRIDQVGLVEAVGAVAERVHGPATALADVARAVRRARVERRAVVLMLPLDVQAAACPDGAAPLADGPGAGAAAAGRVRRGARSPTCSPARGARRSSPGAARCSRAPARRCGRWASSPARCWPPSAVANGLFAGDPYDLGISGGFATPLAARLLGEADVVVAFGAALNQWTTRHGELLAPDATVVQVDLDEEAIGAHRPVALGVIGDARRDRRGARWRRSRAARATAPRGAARAGGARSPPGAGATSPTTRARPPACSTRARSASRSTTCCPHSAPWSSTPAPSWAGRRCTCACPTRPASSSRRPSSASGSRSATRSARRSRGPTA